MTEPFPPYEPEQRTLAYRCSQCETALAGHLQPSGVVDVDPCPNQCKAPVTPDRSTRR